MASKDHRKLNSGILLVAAAGATAQVPSGRAVRWAGRSWGRASEPDPRQPLSKRKSCWKQRPWHPGELYVALCTDTVSPDSFVIPKQAPSLWTCWAVASWKHAAIRSAKRGHRSLTLGIAVTYSSPSKEGSNNHQRNGELMSHPCTLWHRREYSDLYIFLPNVGRRKGEQA